MKMTSFFTILLCFCITAITRAIPKTLLYDYKTSEVSQLPRGDDVSSPQVQLSVPVVLYGIPYESVYVSSACIRVNEVNCQTRNFSLIIAEAIIFDYVKGRGVITLNNDSFRHEGYCSLCKHICTET